MVFLIALLVAVWAAPQEPQCIIVSQPDCVPCKRLEKQLEPLGKVEGIDYHIVDKTEWNKSHPNEQVTLTPTLFLVKDKTTRYVGSKAFDWTPAKVIAYLKG